MIPRNEWQNAVRVNMSEERELVEKWNLTRNELSNFFFRSQITSSRKSIKTKIKVKVNNK